MPVSQGEKFEMMTSESVQTRLVTDPVKELLAKLLDSGHITPEQYKDCFQDINILTVKTNRFVGNKVKFEAPTFGENTTPAMVTDMLGELREKATVDKKMENFLKQKLLALLTSSGQLTPQEPMGEQVDEDGYIL